MIHPLKNPNIPQNKVSVVSIGGNAGAKLLKKLDELKISYIKTINNKSVDNIGSHTDINLLNISDGKIYADVSQRSNFVNFLTKGYSIKEVNGIRSPYPADSGLNCVVIGDKIICNPETICKEISEDIKNNQYSIISVNQGYTKCSICPINFNAIITDDPSIHKACEKSQIDSLLINKGSIQLKGFEYGFIGGCTGLIDADKLLFNGDINNHKDCNKITDFIKRYNVEAITIENEPLTDIGSIIPLCENIADINT